MAPFVQTACERLARGFVAGCLGLLLVGCGPPAPPTDGSTPASSAGPASTTSVPLPPTSGSGTPGPETAGPAPSAPSAETTISGVLVEGAQPSCRNLQTEDGGRWTLTGELATTLVVGDRVTVIGTPRPDLISPCGRVFVVTSWR